VRPFAGMFVPAFRVSSPLLRLGLTDSACPKIHATGSQTFFFILVATKTCLMDKTSFVEHTKFYFSGLTGRNSTSGVCWTALLQYPTLFSHSDNSPHMVHGYLLP
jgi:hypothetical protein